MTNEEIWNLNSTHFLHYHDKEGRTTDGRGIFKPAFDQIMEAKDLEKEEAVAKVEQRAKAIDTMLGEEMEKIQELEAEVIRQKEEILEYKSFQNFHNPRVEELKATVEVMRGALEHCRNRPHEHNPSKDFTITKCEVIDRALSLPLIQKTKAKMEVMERVVEAAKRFMPEKEPIQVERRERELWDTLLAYQELEKKG